VSRNALPEDVEEVFAAARPPGKGAHVVEEFDPLTGAERGASASAA